MWAASGGYPTAGPSNMLLLHHASMYSSGGLQSVVAIYLPPPHHPHPTITEPCEVWRVRLYKHELNHITQTQKVKTEDKDTTETREDKILIV